MALQIISSSLILILSFYVVTIEASRLYGSRDVNLTYTGDQDGFCASAVSVHGYKCQEFEVTTEDGYILSMQRIGGGGGRNKQPVLLQHGVLVDGMTWVLNSPDQSLPFILADNGFDVWIGNGRGTTFSRKHMNLDSSKSEYWDWSWDELVEYDFPATLKFVYGQTGKKINYIGHSMGTLVALAALSQGKMLEKLKSAALLSPVAYLSHMRTPLGVLAAHAFVGEIEILLGIPEFNPGEKNVIKFVKNLCAVSGVNCYDLLTAFTGKNCCLNASTVDTFLKNGPQPTSTKNMVHFAQTVRDGKLAKYDYGMIHNMLHYGQVKPPVYNLTNIPKDIPLYISYGGQDALSDVQDVLKLIDMLKLHDGNKMRVQFVEDYAHADFIIGVTAKETVYDPLIAFFKGS